jgi:hypothetical protein
MVEETFVDLSSDTSAASFPGWRCMICGAILDPVIVQHQAARPAPVFRRSRRQPRQFVASRVDDE